MPRTDLADRGRRPAEADLVEHVAALAAGLPSPFRFRDDAGKARARDR